MLRLCGHLTSPWEQNGAVLPNKKTRADYKGEIRARSNSSHSKGVILQRQPSYQLAEPKYGESPAAIQSKYKVSSGTQVNQPPQTECCSSMSVGTGRNLLQSSLISALTPAFALDYGFVLQKSWKSHSRDSGSVARDPCVTQEEDKCCLLSKSVNFFFILFFSYFHHISVWWKKLFRDKLSQEQNEQVWEP